MPRTGDNYALPYSPVESGTPIESLEYNGTLADIATDLNTPRPVIAGGSGASTVDGALDNLSAEKFKQVVTNWDATVWRAGSFYAATTATGSAPVAGHAFAGIVYYKNATDFVIEATDLDNPLNPQPWVRIQAAGVWGNWMMAAGSAPNKKNYIINGAMQINQENAGASGGIGYYPVDQFWVAGSTTGVIACGQIPLLSPAGSPHRLRVRAATADTSIAVTENLAIYQHLEGHRIADLKFGTAAAKTVTIQFGVCAPAGTYSVVLKSGSSSRSYVAEYVIAAGEANTDVVKSVTIPGSTTGTFTTDNNAGMEVRWGLMAGSNWRTAAGSWATFDAIGSTNQFNLMGTINNIFDLFDVSLTEGSVAPPFVVPDYASELQLCRRYFQFSPHVMGQFVGTTTFAAVIPFNLPMRAQPSVTTKVAASVNEFGVNTYSIGTAGIVSGGTRSIWFSAPSAPAAVAGRIGNMVEGAITIDARL